MRFDQFLKEACPPLDLEWRKYRRRAARHRVEARMEELGLPDYASFLELLRSDPAEAAGLPDRMRVTLSRFFRERGRWEALEEKVLPSLMEEGRPLRIWSAGCCGGEEPYSLAILCLEAARRRGGGAAGEILATDIDEASLERATAALYGVGSLREVPQPLRERYFLRRGRLWQPTEEVRKLVRFERRNLMEDPPPESMDLVLCRYLVFTYYRGERRIEGARRLGQALRPGGALMIARKEELGAAAPLFGDWPGVEGVFRPGDLT